MYRPQAKFEKRFKKSTNRTDHQFGAEVETTVHEKLCFGMKCHWIDQISFLFKCQTFVYIRCWHREVHDDRKMPFCKRIGRTPMSSSRRFVPKLVDISISGLKRVLVDACSGYGLRQSCKTMYKGVEISGICRVHRWLSSWLLVRLRGSDDAVSEKQSFQTRCLVSPLSLCSLSSL